jgi:hypothetical protein
MDAHRNLTVGWVVISLMLSLGFLTNRASAQQAADDMPGVVRGKTASGTAYMMGGVGIDERERMRRLAADYNLKLAFAEKAGVYLAGVDVILEDQSGKEIAAIAANGPWVYLRVPPGSYTVKAAFEGQSRTINKLRVVGQGPTERILTWDLPEEFPIYADMKSREASDQQHTVR